MMQAAKLSKSRFPMRTKATRAQEVGNLTERDVAGESTLSAENSQSLLSRTALGSLLKKLSVREHPRACAWHAFRTIGMVARATFDLGAGWARACGRGAFGDVGGTFVDHVACPRFCIQCGQLWNAQQVARGERAAGRAIAWIGITADRCGLFETAASRAGILVNWHWSVPCSGEGPAPMGAGLYCTGLARSEIRRGWDVDGSVKILGGAIWAWHQVTLKDVRGQPQRRAGIGIIHDARHVALHRGGAQDRQTLLA